MTSSLVYECGFGKYNTNALSRICWVVGSYNVLNVARRGFGNSFLRVSESSASPALGPEIRMIATPAADA